LVVDVLSVRPLKVEFGRALTGNKWDTLLLLVWRLMMINLTGNPDVFVRILNKSCAFRVK
jgi:hypothetical protein